jgi:chromosome segregation ATPase
MTIESMMFFVLGALASALIMLLIMPAVWRRAVRLTKKRIEAATPITLAEFRADKDQLRAEFALSTRRLEMNVEALRKRLAEQLGDVSRKRGDLVVLKGERDEHLAAVRELEGREQVLRERVLELQREGAETAQRLTLRDEQLAAKAEALGDAREAIRATLPASFYTEAQNLTGNYDDDVDELLTALSVERKRGAFFEAQAKELLAQAEELGRDSAQTGSTVASLRQALATKDDQATGANQNLVEAEVRIANAESRLNALLEQTTRIVSNSPHKHEQLLAEKLSLEAQVEQLREKVLNVESTVMADWGSERLEQSHLRERLNDVASDVSRLVYAVDSRGAPDPDESLFDRVQRFADDGKQVDTMPVHNGPAPRPANGSTPPPANRTNGGSVTDRMAALRELQSRN